MRLRSLRFLLPMTLVLGCEALIGCGGGEQSATSPTSTSAPPEPAVTPAPEPAKPPQEAPTAATSAPPEGKRPPIELQPGTNPPTPDPMPKTTISAPKANESVPADKAAAYEVKLEVKDWNTAESGPHVHLILDNKPYKAIYEKKASVKLSELADGEPIAEGQHVLVAFPSTKEHMSIKPAGAKTPVTVVTFWVGKAGKATWKPTDPTLVYSRPKADYNGADAEKILLDFYVLNAELGEGKYSVKATVTPPTGSGGPSTATITNWVPYHILNVPNGESKVRLELLDKSGALVPGAFNPTERSIKVTRQGK